MYEPPFLPVLRGLTMRFYRDSFKLQSLQANTVHALIEWTVGDEKVLV